MWRGRRRRRRRRCADEKAAAVKAAAEEAGGEKGRSFGKQKAGKLMLLMLVPRRKW